MLYKFLLFALLIGMNDLEGGWLERKAEGWAWYEEEEKEVESPIEPESQMTAISQLEEIKKQLETLMAEAILNPSSENVAAYMEAQKQWMNHSVAFSGAWQKILLARPDLDPTATTFATTYYGRLLQKSLEQEGKTKSIHKISKEYGLVFFYEGEKKGSQAFSKVVKALSQKYQWPVVAISMDGLSLAEFPSEHNVELAAKFGVAIYPALLAFEPAAHKMIPLAFGLKSLDQVEHNVYMQLKNTEE
jgi:conjugal transfer pilus assembly protein TraF